MNTSTQKYIIAYGNFDAGLVDFHSDRFAAQSEARQAAYFWLETNWDREDIQWVEVRNTQMPNAKAWRIVRKNRH